MGLDIVESTEIRNDFHDVKLQALPLSGVTTLYGKAGLSRLFLLETELLEESEQELCVNALALALYLHEDDEYKGDPYSTHLLRVATRMAREFDVNDPELLAAGVLHDSVEDHREKLLTFGKMMGIESDDPEAVLGQLFTPRVAELVMAVSNPESPPDIDRETKNQQYRENIRQKIQISLDVFILKLSDFIDNGVGLHWGENPELTLIVAKKYEPVFDVFITQARTYYDEGLLNDAELSYIIDKMVKGKETAQAFLAAAA